MGKHDDTLAAVFANPVRANLNWHDIESMIAHVGAEVTEGSGSRVRIALNGVRAVFHRPHPRHEASRPMVRSVRAFLSSAGVIP